MKISYKKFTYESKITYIQTSKFYLKLKKIDIGI